MTGEQLKLLSKMKKLIVIGDRRFAQRNDRDYLQSLLEIGITEEMAWKEVLNLSSKDYIPDYSLLKSRNALTFKKNINNLLVYIKIKIEEYANIEVTICLSFHIDFK